MQTVIIVPEVYESPLSGCLFYEDDTLVLRGQGGDTSCPRTQKKMSVSDIFLGGRTRLTGCYAHTSNARKSELLVRASMAYGLMIHIGSDCVRSACH